jgi:hypothetical protein
MSAVFGSATSLGATPQEQIASPWQDVGGPRRDAGRANIHVATDARNISVRSPALDCRCRGGAPKILPRPYCRGAAPVAQRISSHSKSSLAFWARDIALTHASIAGWHLYHDPRRPRLCLAAWRESIPPHPPLNTTPADFLLSHLLVTVTHLLVTVTVALPDNGARRSTPGTPTLPAPTLPARCPGITPVVVSTIRWAPPPLILLLLFFLLPLIGMDWWGLVHFSFGVVFF